MKQARAFYTLILLSTGIGVGLDFAGINPVKALCWTAVINGLLAPFLLVAILIVASDKKLMQELCSLDQPNHPFQAYALSIEQMNSQSRGVPYAFCKKWWNMSQGTSDPIPKLHRAPQPPLSHPGATPDSDRAKRPPLAEPSATGDTLTPGDRVEGLGNFGTPTGEFGTVERANEEDAVVKWDDDGRTRLHQPSLKKI